MIAFAKETNEKDAAIRVMMHTDIEGPLDCSACGSPNALDVGTCTTSKGAVVGYAICGTCQRGGDPTDETLAMIDERIAAVGSGWLTPIDEHAPREPRV